MRIEYVSGKMKEIMTDINKEYYTYDEWKGLIKVKNLYNIKIYYAYNDDKIPNDVEEYYRKYMCKALSIEIWNIFNPDIPTDCAFIGDVIMKEGVYQGVKIE